MSSNGSEPLDLITLDDPGREQGQAALEDALVPGLVGRLRTLMLVLDRTDALEDSDFIGWMEQEGCTSDELVPAARELLWRTLRQVGDPASYVLLQVLCARNGLTTREALAISGAGRVATTERLRDLLQAGLAAGGSTSDALVPTSAGRALVDLVERSANRAADEMAVRFANRPRP